MTWALQFEISHRSIHFWLSLLSAFFRGKSYQGMETIFLKTADRD
jgi:hypothetical protein